MFRHLALGGFVAAMLASNSWAVLKHHYPFTTNANDVVGAAHGTLQNNAQIIAGALALDAAGTFTGIAGPVVQLPAATIGINTYVDATFEGWYTLGSNANWQRLFDFGRINPAEATQGGNYIFVSPRPGNQTQTRVALSNTAPGFNLESASNGAGVASHRLVHVAVVIDDNAVRTGGETMTIYVNGVAGTPVTLQAGMTGNPPVAVQQNLAGVSNELAYIGGSLYSADATFRGTINDFKIYDNALTAEQVLANFQAGPPDTVGPTATIDRNTGVITLSSTRPGVRVTGIRMTSGNGALTPAAWTPVAGRLDQIGNGTFDPDGIWERSVETTGDLFELDPVGDGGLLGTGAGALGSITLGNAGLWTKNPSENIAINVTILNNGVNTVVPAQVNFTGNNGNAYQRSDLNFDGSINGDDYVIFRGNLRKAVDPALSDAQSYALGDLNGDQQVNFQDFRLFQGDFTAVNGAAAFAAVAGAVPEPAAASLALIAAAALLRRRRQA